MGSPAFANTYFVFKESKSSLKNERCMKSCWTT